MDMSVLKDLILQIVPVLVTGFITFFITRYSCRNQTDTNKLEKAYNKFYYPVFQYVFKHPNLEEFEELIHLCEELIRKNEKYINIKTIEIYNSFKKANEQSNRENIRNCYKVFERNIKQSNRRLRNRIGYFQPELVDSYSTWSEENQVCFWIIVLTILCYVLEIIHSVCPPEWSVSFVIEVFFLSVLLVLVILIVALIAMGIIHFWRKIKNRR